MFASEIDGARSWLNCAFRMMQFPIGVFGVAIATVTLPAVARLHSRGEMTEAGKTIEEALRLALFLTLPAAVGLAVLAPDIIQVIYQHGAFTPASTAATASALRAYALGLAAYAAIKVLTPCFYALDRRRTPLNVSLAGIGLCIILNFIMVKLFHLGHVGLAATTGCLAILNFAQLAVYLRRDVQFGTLRAWTRFGLLVGGAAGACGLTAWLLKSWLVGLGPALSHRILALAIEMGVAGLVYFGLTLVFRINETHYIAGVVRRKLVKRA
jgi:putative peptidoglycan lipid II flippase